MAPSPYDDYTNLVTFLEEMREAFDASGVKAYDGSDLSISMAVAANTTQSYGGKPIGYNWPELIKYLDWVGVMTYDIHGSWNQMTDAHVPFDDDYHNQLDIVSSISEFNSQGVPYDKLVLGIAAYGKGWSNVDMPSLGVPGSGPSPAGKYTKSDGFLAYYEIEELIEDGTYSYYWDDKTKTPFIYSATDKVLVGYEDENSLEYKLDYIQSKDLAGAMIWAIDLDMFQDKEYPLIGAISNRLK